MSTPAGRFRRMSVSIVLELGSSTSIKRLCVRNLKLIARVFVDVRGALDR